MALTRALQRELVAGATPGEALRRARLEVAREDGTQDPFYFGLVYALGTAHQRR